MPVVPCQNPACVKSFTANLSTLERGRKYCSHECYAKARTVSEYERFWSFVAVCQHGKRCIKCCWEWQGCKNARGYGKIGLKSSNTNRIITEYAHRFMWEMTNGPLLLKLSVLHDCPNGDNPSCVNPAHLWLGTPGDNMHDMIRKGRHMHGGQHTHAKLTEDDVRLIRELVKAGHTQYWIAAKFGVNQHAISSIVTGKHWGHVL